MPLENPPFGLSTVFIQTAGKCTEHKGFPPETSTAKQGVIIMELKSLGTFHYSLGIKKKEVKGLVKASVQRNVADISAIDNLITS